jgi:hypothetical protein
MNTKESGIKNGQIYRSRLWLFGLTLKGGVILAMLAYWSDISPSTMAFNIRLGVISLLAW